MESKSTQPQPSSFLLTNQKEIENILTTGYVLTFIIVVVMMSRIAFLIHTYRPKRKQNSKIFPPLPKAQCDRCQYFSRNAYLQCAIHPSTVMTSQALSCNDYQASKEHIINRGVSQLLRNIQGFFF
jgi:hypothetical protein